MTENKKRYIEDHLHEYWDEFKQSWIEIKRSTDEFLAEPDPEAELPDHYFDGYDLVDSADEATHRHSATVSLAEDQDEDANDLTAGQGIDSKVFYLKIKPRDLY